MKDYQNQGFKRQIMNVSTESQTIITLAELAEYQ
jgi:hypothetical protein